MKHWNRWAAPVAMALALTGSAPAWAQGTGGQVIYVSAGGSDQSGNGSQAAPFASIGKAVEAAQSGDTIIVEPGTYPGMVTVTKSITLESDPSIPDAVSSTIVDASGSANGILLQGGGASGSTIRGLTVEHAQQAGILAVGPMTGLDITGNVVADNDQGFVANDAKAPFDGHCSAMPGGDCEALHLMGVSDSRIVDNVVRDNLDGGIYLTDETGPAARNVVLGNDVVDNQVDCGITLASHNPKGSADPSAAGVYDNVVADNRSKGNGAAGVVLATPLPGGAVYGNTVTGNTFVNNSQGGVVFHTHSPGAMVADNAVIGNTVTGNGADPDPGVTKPVGISIAGMGSPITGLLVSGNRLDQEYYGIWVENAPDAQLHGNTFTNAVALPYTSATPTPPAAPP